MPPLNEPVEFTHDTIDVAGILDAADQAKADAAPKESGGTIGNLYRRLMGGSPSSTDPFGLPTLTPDLYASLFPGAAQQQMPTTAKSERVGQGPLANKPLPVEGGGKGAKIVKAAESLVGLPYVWGGTSASKGVDCSGLVQLAYKAAGINLPRVSNQQANSGQRIPLDELRPGDIVAWDLNGRNVGADHIAVYVGGGKIIEAARPGTNVRVTNLYNTGNAWGVRITGGN